MYLYQPFCNSRETDLLCPDTALLPGKLHLTSAGGKRSNKASCSSTKFCPWIFASTWYDIINVFQTWTFSLPYQNVYDCNRLLKIPFFFPEYWSCLAQIFKNFQNRKKPLFTSCTQLPYETRCIPAHLLCCRTSWIPKKLKPSLYRMVLGRQLSSSVHWLEREDRWNLGLMYHSQVKAGQDTQ